MKPISVTIFVHGTRLFPKFYLQELFYSPAGLVKIGDLEKSSHMHTIAHVLSTEGPGRFSYEHFYAFGWNGKLSFAARLRAARDLYVALLVLREKYRQIYKVDPDLRLVTHSHGGNVVLCLSQVGSMHTAALFIKDVILLACPVQDATKNAICSEMFGTCYTFASFADCFQVIDPQGLYAHAKKGTPLFSKRFFPPCPKVFQAAVLMRGRWMFHVEFFLKPFLSRLPKLLDVLDACHGAKKDNFEDGIALVRLKKNHIEIARLK